jgi:acid stress-induced BolA-like protein IbaG/YrbA
VPTPKELEMLITAALPGARVVVHDLRGTGDHFEAFVEANQFRDRSLVEQHRMVYAAVRELMSRNEIHALSIRTAIPES